MFLLFALPIPLGLTEQIHWQLRLIATAATSTVLSWVGVPVFVEGTTLHLARGAVQVADACSGFSTLYAAMAVACLTAYSAPSNARRALVLLAAAPVAIASNLLRVIFLVLLVVWQGAEILETFLHPLSGMMTFALALPVIFWLGEGRSGALGATGACRCDGCDRCGRCGRCDRCDRCDRCGGLARRSAERGGGCGAFPR